ncbi:MAG TPA: sulfatase-like hydrolase/transferase [Pontiellaceae bacterium]|nr:sulfatase-like hydrolase/transferase [Pontiellaceae bacterium]
MKNPGFLKIAGVELAALTLTACQVPAEKSAVAGKPNIIFILTDDVGLGDIGCCGGPFKTPNIDVLAKSGTRFELCYSAPLCGPSRCQALTGRYPFRTGLNSNNSKDAIDPSREVMIPTVMKKAGYATASAGKWGQMCFGPGEWGFDEYVVFQGSGRYWGEQTPTYVANGKPTALPQGKYLPDLMHEFVTDFMTRHKDQPFFIYYPMVHVHGPILRTPDSKEGAGKDQLYKDNVEYMDKLVGKLMAELDRLQLREKTIVIFTGDNGTAHFGVDLATVNGKPISGMKGTMLEGGSRVPLIASWPGRTPAGQVNRDLIDFSDFFPTFAELGGATLPPGVTIDGHSFAAQIRGEKGTPRDWIYVELSGKSYARNAGFKLTNHGALFDMSKAPFQEIPVPASTTNAAAASARAVLQKVLDDHPAAPAADPKNGKKKNKRANKKAGKQAGEI